MKGERILVTGCNRSGTSLLMACIGLNKEIAMMENMYYSPGMVIGKKLAIKITIPFILWKKKRIPPFIWIFKKLSKFIYIRGINGDCVQDFDKIVFISRNYRKNIESIMKRTGRSHKSAVKDWRIANTIKKKLNKSNIPTYFTTMYKFTTYTESELKKICKFLSIDYDPIMLEGYKYTTPYSNTEILLKK